MANSTSSQLHLIGVVAVSSRWTVSRRYMVCHGASKSTGFMVVGSVSHYTGTMKSRERLSQSKLTGVVLLRVLICLRGLLRARTREAIKDSLSLLLSLTPVLAVCLSLVASPAYLKEMVPLSDSIITLGALVTVCVLLATSYYLAQTWSPVRYRVI